MVDAVLLEHRDLFALQRVTRQKLTIWSQLKEEIYQGIDSINFIVRQIFQFCAVRTRDKYSSATSSLCGSNFRNHAANLSNRSFLAN